MRSKVVPACDTDDDVLLRPVVDQPALEYERTLETCVRRTPKNGVHAAAGVSGESRRTIDDDLGYGPRAQRPPRRPEGTHRPPCSS